MFVCVCGGGLEQGVLIDESILIGVGVAGAGGTNRRVHIDGGGGA